MTGQKALHFASGPSVVSCSHPIPLRVVYNADDLEELCVTSQTHA